MTSKNAIRVSRSRAKLRAQGLRPIQIWVPDIHAPGFAEELARQCRAENEWAKTTEGKAELDFWEAVGAEAMADVPAYDWGPDGPPKQ